jgi:hypothetical protein
LKKNLKEILIGLHFIIDVMKKISFEPQN